MVSIEYALRDERINILAMTGQVPGVQQLILCKKQALPTDGVGPFILDAKKSKSPYRLSTIGSAREAETSTLEPELKYLAFIDCQIQLAPSVKCMEWLCQSHFALWHPDGTLNYFAGNANGYLVVFRVLELIEAIPDQLLERGRSGRNPYFRLEQPVVIGSAKAIIARKEFDDLKTDLITGLRETGSLISVQETEARQK